MAPNDPPSKLNDVVFGDDDASTVASVESNDLEEPLISKDSDEIEMKEYSMKWSKYYSLIIGLIIGCFIQFSSLGANFLMTSMYGYDVFFTREFIIISLIWCFVTSVMGVAVLLFLRSLLVTSFYATTVVNDSFKSKEDFVANLIQHMEYYFAVGSLIGVCLSWTVTDVLLGMKAHIIHSLITLAVALIWCRLVMKFCGNNQNEDGRRTVTIIDA